MTRIRSFVDAIGALDATGLATLFRLRPDLATPAPADLAELIERASTTPSVQASMDRLNAWQLRVLQTVTALEPPITAHEVAAALGTRAPSVTGAVRDLLDRALLWSSGRLLHPVLAVRSVMGRFPAGLAPRSNEPLPEEQLTEALAMVAPPERAILERLTWGPPTGQVKNARRHVTLDTAHTPIERLLALKLLRPIDDDTVIVPREVAWRLRDGLLFNSSVEPSPTPWPAPLGADRKSVTDLAGLGSAVELVAHLAALLEALSQRTPKALANGGMGVRDLHSLGTIVGDTELAGLLLEVAREARLIGQAAGLWLPTRGYDAWLELSGWHQWLALRDAYLRLGSWPDAKTHVLDRAALTPWAAQARTDAVAQLADAPPATPVDAATLASRLGWLHPSWESLDLNEVAHRLISELSSLGMLALGTRTPLADATDDPGFPAPVERIIIESDLSAIAPGPLRYDVARTMSMLTQPESHGGGLVARFTRTSLRSAMDAGWTGEQILTWVGEHTATDVPQPLRYLIGDVARDYGRVEVAAVSSLLTLSDHGHVVALLRHPEATALGLREVAPGVLVAAAEADELVAFLQSVGLAPMARTATGERWVTPPAPRAPAPAPRPMPVTPDADALATQLLSTTHTDDPRAHTTRVMTALRAAQESGTWSIVTYVDADGAPQQVNARVLAVGKGGARIVPRASAPITLLLSRIVNVTLTED